MAAVGLVWRPGPPFAAEIAMFSNEAGMLVEV